MIWIIVIIIAVLCAIFGDWYDTGDAVFMGFISLFVIGLLAGFICFICGAFVNYNETPELVSTTYIQAMNDGSAVNGKFGGGIFCASGTIDEKPVYKVLTVTEKGLQTKTYKAEETYVRFTDGEPRVEQVKYEAVGFLNFFCGDGMWDKTEYIIYIPEDSVVADGFVLDLQ